MTEILVVLVALVLVAATVAAASVRVLREYERAVVFRLGRLIGKKGPGLVLLVPVVDRGRLIGVVTRRDFFRALAERFLARV